MILDKEVSAEQNYAQGYGCEGEQIKFSAHSLDSGAFANSSLLVFESQNLSHTAFSSGGVAWGNNDPGLQSGSFEVRVVNLSSVESAGGWSTPSGNLLVCCENSKGISGVEIQAGQPTDLVTEEWIVNLNSLFGVDDAGIDNIYPVDQADSQQVDQAHDYSVVPARYSKADYCGESDQEDYRQVDPTTSGSVNISILHKRQTTSVSRLQFSDLATKKGAQS